MGRILSFFYGVVSYAVFLVAFLYAVGFVSNRIVPKTIDSAESGTLGSALLINALLLGLFAIQHTIMARPSFKRMWTRIIPAPVERSTFVLLTSLILLLLYWQWQPINAVVWHVTQPVASMALWGLFGLGWAIVFFSTFMINHFDLFGLRQVALHLQGKEYTHLDFTQSVLYTYVRHPIMLGFIIAFWATPLMTAGHLLFAVMTTGYILVGVTIEERDLVAFHGETYEEYRRKVPMIVPFLKL